MDVMEAPLNLAHQQSRRADRLLAAGKYEEAISCHKKATAYLLEAMKQTQSEQAHLSLELQRDSHMKQLLLVQERWKRAQREERLRDAAAPGPLEPPAPSPSPAPAAAPGPGPAPSPAPAADRDPDTLLFLLQQRSAPAAPPPPARARAPEDPQTLLEEQAVRIAALTRHVRLLAADNERLRRENARLRGDPDPDPGADPDAHLVERSELWSLPPAAWRRLAEDIPVPSLPPLDFPSPELSEDALRGFLLD